MRRGAPGRCRDAEEVPGRCRGGYGGAGRVAVAELTLIAARKRRPQVEWSGVQSSWSCGGGCPNARYAVRRPVRVSACSGVRVSSGGCAGVRSAGVRCPVSARLVSASDPVRVRVGSWNVGAAGQRLAVGRASSGVVARRVREWPGCLLRLAVVAAGGGRAGGGVGCGGGRRLGTPQAAAASRFDRLAEQGQPGCAPGSPVGWLGIMVGSVDAREARPSGYGCRGLSWVSSGQDRRR
jgi:hypothetical protein